MNVQNTASQCAALIIRTTSSSEIGRPCLVTRRVARTGLASASPGGTEDRDGRAGAAQARPGNGDSHWRTGSGGVVAARRRGCHVDSGSEDGAGRPCVSVVPVAVSKGTEGVAALYAVDPQARRPGPRVITVR